MSLLKSQYLQTYIHMGQDIHNFLSISWLSHNTVGEQPWEMKNSSLRMIPTHFLNSMAQYRLVRVRQYWAGKTVQIEILIRPNRPVSLRYIVVSILNTKTSGFVIELSSVTKYWRVLPLPPAIGYVSTGQ